jgi:hypothetical protein
MFEFEFEKPSELVQAFIDALRTGKPITWDEFFDSQNVSEDMRSDFASAAILRQAKIHAPDLFPFKQGV